jgi:hypothetical protein
MKTISRCVLIAVILIYLGCVSPVLGLTASEVLQKAQEKYKSLSSYSATGKSVAVMSPADPGASKKSADTKDLNQRFIKPQIFTHTFTIKLARPDLYRVEWESQVTPALIQKGAVWSAGDGDFLFMGAGASQSRYARMTNQEMALASATGISGGVAHTIPSVFFPASSMNMLKVLAEPILHNEEKIDGEDCYTVAGKVNGREITFWIGKDSFLIRQRRHTIGGAMSHQEMSDENIKRALKGVNKEATPEAIAEMRKTMQKMMAEAARQTGSTTETHQNIVINKPIAKEDFKYPVPEGLKLSSSPF